MIQIGDADRPIVHPIDQMLANARGKIVPTLDLGRQLHKDHAAQSLTEPFHHVRVSGIAEPFGKVEELFLFVGFWSTSVFNNGFPSGSHYTIMQQI